MRWLYSLLPLLATGCLVDANLDPTGYLCLQDSDCEGELTCQAGTCAVDPLQPLLRLRGPMGTEVLMFESPESAALLARGYVSDGPVVRAFTTDAPGLVTVLRLHRPDEDDYLLTASTNEATNAQAAGYRPEGVAFHGGAVSGTGIPVYRVQRSSAHHYPVGEAARDQKVAAGWNLEFTLFRGSPL